MKNTSKLIDTAWRSIASRPSVGLVHDSLQRIAGSVATLRAMTDVIRKKSVPNFIRRHIHLSGSVPLFIPSFH